MTYSPQSYLDVRALFQRKTGLPPESLGIQHYSPQGGGYHEGNDLLAAAGRLDSDYSKRESDRDRPGTNGASAIDIGWFDVVLPNGRRVTLTTLNLWMERNWNAPDALWLREWIYSVDGRTVKRLDRLGIRTSGDDSHLTHAHGSGFRDEENTNKVALFERFWREMEGDDMSVAAEAEIERIGWRVVALLYNTPTVTGGTMAGERNQLREYLDRIAGRLTALESEWAGERTRDAATTAALGAVRQQVAAGGGDVNVAAIVARINEVAEDDTAEFAALRAELRDAHEEVDRLRMALAAAERAGAAMLDPGSTPTP